MHISPLLVLPLLLGTISQHSSNFSQAIVFFVRPCLPLILVFAKLLITHRDNVSRTLREATYLIAPVLILSILSSIYGPSQGEDRDYMSYSTMLLLLTVTQVLSIAFTLYRRISKELE